MDSSWLSDTGIEFQEVTAIVRTTGHESLQFLQICAISTIFYLYFSTIFESVDIVQNRKRNICSRRRRKVIFS